jgi:hypothetical protein
MTTGEFKKWLQEHNIPDETLMRIMPGYLEHMYADKPIEPHIGVVVKIEHNNNTIWLNDADY